MAAKCDTMKKGKPKAGFMRKQLTKYKYDIYLIIKKKKTNKSQKNI